LADREEKNKGFSRVLGGRGGREKKHVLLLTSGTKGGNPADHPQTKKKKRGKIQELTSQGGNRGGEKTIRQKCTIAKSVQKGVGGLSENRSQGNMVASRMKNGGRSRASASGKEKSPQMEEEKGPDGITGPCKTERE